MGPFLAFPASRQGGDGLESTALTDSCRWGPGIFSPIVRMPFTAKLDSPDSSHSDSAAGTGLHALRTLAADQQPGNGLCQAAPRATATYASCGKVNLPPSSIARVDTIAVLEATDEMTAWRSGSALSFRRTVIGVARRCNRTS